MFWNSVILVLVPIVGTGLIQQASAQDDLESTLTRAQALYYEARFKDSVELLLPLDAVLEQQPSRMSQSIRVKLQLALGYIGQNQNAQAKSVFQEVCALDAAYSLEASQFAPKVLTLFNEAKAEQKKAQCEARCSEIDKFSKSADVHSLLRLAGEAAETCTCEATAAAAELLYTQGVDAYKRGDFPQAVETLRAAIKFRPGHELAVQYAELAESKTKLIVEQNFLDWRKYFEAHEFSRATPLYRQLEAVNFEGKADAALAQMRGEYRKVVASRVESFNQSCATGATPSLDLFRQQTRDLLPSDTIAADLLSKVSSCEPVAVAPVANAKPPVANVEPPVVSAAAPTGCLEMPSQQAMARIKSQTTPNIPFDRFPMADPVRFLVKVKIDENGNVLVREIEGTNVYVNEVMRAAVERWKFLPAIVQDQRRCVETELPVVIKRS